MEKLKGIARAMKKQVEIQEKQLDIQRATFDLMRVSKFGYHQITFILHPPHQDGAMFAVVGDALELGFWKQPVWMRRIGDHFTTKVILPPTQKKIQWKFIVKYSTGKLQWEGGNNRELTLDGQQMHVVDGWWRS